MAVTVMAAAGSDQCPCTDDQGSTRMFADHYVRLRWSSGLPAHSSLTAWSVGGSPSALARTAHHVCLFQLKIARAAPRVLGFATEADDPSGGRPALHRNFCESDTPIACTSPASTSSSATTSPRPSTSRPGADAAINFVEVLAVLDASQMAPEQPRAHSIAWR